MKGAEPMRGAARRKTYPELLQLPPCLRERHRSVSQEVKDAAEVFAAPVDEDPAVAVGQNLQPTGEHRPQHIVVLSQRPWKVETITIKITITKIIIRMT